MRASGHAASCTQVMTPHARMHTPTRTHTHIHTRRTHTHTHTHMHICSHTPRCRREVQRINASLAPHLRSHATQGAQKLSGEQEDWRGRWERKAPYDTGPDVYEPLRAAITKAEDAGLQWNSSVPDDIKPAAWVRPTAHAHETPHTPRTFITVRPTHPTRPAPSLLHARHGSGISIHHHTRPRPRPTPPPTPTRAAESEAGAVARAQARRRGCLPPRCAPDNHGGIGRLHGYDRAPSADAPRRRWAGGRRGTRHPRHGGPPGRRPGWDGGRRPPGWAPRGCSSSGPTNAAAPPGLAYLIR